MRNMTCCRPISDDFVNFKCFESNDLFFSHLKKKLGLFSVHCSNQKRKNIGFQMCTFEINSLQRGHLGHFQQFKSKFKLMKDTVSRPCKISME